MNELAQRTRELFPLLCSIALLAIPTIGQTENTTSLKGEIIKCPYMPPHLTKIPTCGGERVTCMGTDGHDLIWGTDVDDVIYGDAGNDVIQADAGDDIVCGGEGDDAIHGARGNDTIYGDEGTDWLFGARGADTLYGGPGDLDVLWGGPSYDKLDGGPGDRDFCLQQREMAEVNDKTCEVIYPPLGYLHDQNVEIPPGVVERLKFE